MHNIIRLKKISFYAYHGVFKQEQNIGGKFEVDVEIYTDFHIAAQNDTLNKTVDYEKVYKTIIELSDSHKYKLIETLAMHIADALFTKFEHISKVIIRLRKNNPPIGGVVDSVEVEVEKSREDFLQSNNIPL